MTSCTPLADGNLSEDDAESIRASASTSESLAVRLRGPCAQQVTASTLQALACVLAAAAAGGGARCDCVPLLEACGHQDTQENDAQGACDLAPVIPARTVAQTRG